MYENPAPQGRIFLFQIIYLYKMQIFYQPDAPAADWLPEEESKHCVRVLRHRTGDTIMVTNGRNQLYACKLTTADPARCVYSLLHELPQPLRKHAVHLAIAPTKNTDRLEWMLEKCVELGIDSIHLLQCQHSERIKLKAERLEKKAISAMKQSLNLQLPLIHEPVAFTDFITSGALQNQSLFIAYVNEEHRQHLFNAAAKDESCCILIGPEGDFSSAEISAALTAGFTPVSLGPSRLRTETAGLTACHILNLINHIA